LAIANPSPVPPFFFVIEESACWNSSKIFACSASAMPGPVSRTATVNEPLAAKALIATSPGVEPGAWIDVLFHDQEDSRRILRDLLTSADYEMTDVNGEEALASVEKQRPDLILMDIQMPVLDGYEATRRIKADPALKNVPIIVVTSYASSGGDEAKARAAGCDDFVPKPFSPRQLLARIRKLLS
jgi:two-component system cell cycle response regulator DivK